MLLKINKKNAKVYFLIVNLVVAIFAFSYLINGAVVDSSGNPIGSADIYSNSPLATGGGTGCGAGSCAGVSNLENLASESTTIKSAGVGETGIQKIQGGLSKGINSYFGANLLQNLLIAGLAGTVGAFIGSWAGGKNGELWGFVSFFSGATVFQILYPWLGLWSLLPGTGVTALIFLLTYRENFEEKAEFNCLPWQAPVGGKDCEKCNSLPECSEYSCKSLGQACGIVNAGKKEQKCVWLNPYDTNSPMVSIKDITQGYKSIPDKAVRPPAIGVEIITTNGISVDNSDCIKAFTPLEFTISSDEPSQCKIDYKQTNFSEMSFYAGGEEIFAYNHTEKLSLPGPNAINKIAPEIKNDGIYNLYVKCQDANGNVNVNPFSIRFCVEKGPDTTPPYIVNTSVPSGSPIQFNKTSIDIEVYVNEPSDCKWSRQDISYDNMENSMSCDNQIWEMNSNEVYTCRTSLNGLESRKENNYYFKCKDQPWEEESKRNVMQESFSYKLIGTQPLNIISVGPSGTIYGATDSIPVYLSINTDNGYDNGRATCYYSLNSKPDRDEDYIQFLDTNENEHKQRQDLISGNYVYYFKCVDLGGNTVYNSTNFRVETDRQMPVIFRVYKEAEQLKVMTNENADCSYSVKNCNFEIKDGIKMETMNYVSHTAEWKINQGYYIRCKDKYSNQPDPNTCSIVVKPAMII